MSHRGASMPKKRKRDSGAQKNQGGQKRQHHTDDADDDDGVSAFKAARGYFDPSTGQRGAFPGLDEDGDAFFCGPANDGMDYLRMVRSEARGVPSLLIAKRPIPPAISYTSRDPGWDYDDEEDYAELEAGADYAEENEAEEEQDTRGWYVDGTYIGAGIAAFPERPPSPNKLALLAWHESFMANYRRLRALLHDSDNNRRSATSTTKASNAVANDLPLPHRQEDWLDLLHNTSPTPKFLWRMDQHMILKGFKINMDLIKIGTDTPVEQTRWIYGMLLRCSDTMTADEQYIVRDLGKRAIHVQKKLEKSNCLSEKKPSENDDSKQQQVVEATDLHNNNHDQEDGEVLEQGNLAPTSHVGTSRIDSQPDGPSSAANGSGIEPGNEKNIESAEPSQTQAEKNLDTDAIPVETAKPTGTGDTSKTQKRRKNRALKDGNYDYTPSANTLGTLDMIISIVGDFFGQRDLLEERVFHSLGGTWAAS
ncbi:hypothetical protein DFH27DRAFT_556998 [Peziza echinospora]|nr:hypothetical protein DFH27DRAFT_556998 [Peziza echinospora]